MELSQQLPDYISQQRSPQGVSIDPVPLSTKYRSPRLHDFQSQHRGSPRVTMQHELYSKRSLLDREERDLINLAGNLSKEEIWQRLEEKRFTQLKKAAVNLQSEMIFQNRCPKCTLQPPCKHYQTYDQILQEGPQLIQHPQFKQYITPKRREVIMKTLREQRSSQLSNSQFEMAAYQSQLRFQNSGQQQDAKPEEAQPNAFLTNLNEEIEEFPPDTSRRKAAHRNQFNHTVTGAMTGGVAQGQDHKSHLSQYGANLMNNQFLKKQQYLRKRQGNGGSPVDFYTHNDSAGPLVPRDKLSQNLREKTTVRVRTKNNEFVYGEASFHNPLQTTKNNQRSSLIDSSQVSLYEKERLQAMIAKYKEDKIQRQIEKIEQERYQIEEEKRLQIEQELKRRRHLEEQKQRIYEYQQIKQKEEQEKAKEEKMKKDREIERARLRRDYFERQRKQISEYREQKRKTDELLMIPSQHETSLERKGKPPAQFPAQPYYLPIYNKGLVTKAGQSFLGGQASNNQQKNRHQYNQADLEENFDEEEFDMYYQDQEIDALSNPLQPQPAKTQPVKKSSDSTGIIGDHKKSRDDEPNEERGESPDNHSAEND